MKCRMPYSRCGFTMVEMMIAVGLFGLVMAGSIGVYMMCNRLWRATELHMQTARETSMALSRLVYGIGPNSGLRGASSIIINTNMYGTNSANYYPLSPGNAAHYVTNGSPDGSWRISMTNNLWGGEKWIDYNKQASNVVYWPVAAYTAASNRLLICNYVSDAVVTTNRTTNSAVGIVLDITVSRTDGQNTATKTLQTFIRKRNK